MGERQRELGTAEHFVSANFYVTGKFIDHLLHDGEAETRSRQASTLRSPIEPVENTWCILGVNTRSTVTNDHTALVDDDAYLAAFGRELNGVGQQIGDSTLESVTASEGDAWLGRDVDVNVFNASVRARSLDTLLDELVETNLHHGAFGMFASREFAEVRDEV